MRPNPESSKPLREKHLPGLGLEVALRHRLLADAGLPVPPVISASDDAVILRELPGQTLAEALFTDVIPSGSEIVDLLDALPVTVLELPRIEPWAFGVEAATKTMDADVQELARGLAARLVPGTQNDPTHGDFHEGQILVDEGRIVGLLDLDAVGPGERVDDLACLVGHVACIQSLSPANRSRRDDVLASWVRDFDQRVDPEQLRLRAACVALTLAADQQRLGAEKWAVRTADMVRTARMLVDY